MALDALNGTTLHGSLDGLERAVQLLSLLDQATGCVLSRMRVESTRNIARTALELLETLALPAASSPPTRCLRAPRVPANSRSRRPLLRGRERQPSQPSRSESQRRRRVARGPARLGRRRPGLSAGPPRVAQRQDDAQGATRGDQRGREVGPAPDNCSRGGAGIGAPRTACTHTRRGPGR